MFRNSTGRLFRRIRKGSSFLFGVSHNFLWQLEECSLAARGKFGESSLALTGGRKTVGIYKSIAFLALVPSSASFSPLICSQRVKAP